MNFVHDLPFGEDNNSLNTIIEISKGSMNKVEYSTELGIFELDRVEPGIFAKPVNYGFIPQTWDEDNDPLDTLIITEEALPMGLLVKVKVVGVLNFVDDGENDHKIICVPMDDRNTGSVINDVTDLSDAWKKKLEHHFMHYKDLKKPGSTKVEGFGNKGEAWKIIMESNVRYSEKYNK